MKQRLSKSVLLLYSIFLLSLLFTGCGGSSDSASSSAKESNSKSENTALTATPKGTRDNTPVVLSPNAEGTTIHSCDQAILDVSNQEEGYIMAVKKVMIVLLWKY